MSVQMPLPVRLPMPICKAVDTADWRQYHPYMTQHWVSHITAYRPQHIKSLAEVITPQEARALNVNPQLVQVMAEGFRRN